MKETIIYIQASNNVIFNWTLKRGEENIIYKGKYMIWSISGCDYVNKFERYAENDQYVTFKYSLFKNLS